MKSSRIKVVAALGLLAIAAIIALQLHWFRAAFNYEEKKFGEKVHIALLEVVKLLYRDPQKTLPPDNPVNKVSEDYYIVDINDDFDAEVLEFYLRKEFGQQQLGTDFEYAIYDCETDEMVYGNYINYDRDAEGERTSYFPKSNKLVYYFAVRFPDRAGYFVSSLRLWIILSAILLFILLLYVYSIFIIFRQKRYSELQKDFINNMTHEFKTPLSSILIASNFLSRQSPISGNPRLATYVRSILSQGERLNTHVERILNLAKSENAPLQLELSRFKLVETLQDIRDNFLLKHPGACISLQADTAWEIEADRTHFGNLVYNLLDNAVKYSGSTPEIRLGVRQEGRSLMLEVADKGIGIPEKDQKMIFDKFYRVARKESSPVHGFGLGLYYVKRICRQHAWQLKLWSMPGSGTTVTITLPKIV
jgi:two-component system phosphate regulon sensor histidine kinase PhoR